MTITPTVLTAGATLTDGDSTTASITPAANALILAWVVAHTDFDVTTAPTLTGNGITWTLVDIATRDDGTVCVTLALFRGTSASPTPGAISIDWPGSPVPRNSAWSIEQYEDVALTEGDQGVIQAATGSGTGTALAATLAAFADAGNMTVEGGAGFASGLNIAREAGYTALSTDLAASNLRLSTAFLASEHTSPTMTADVSTPWAMIAVELAAVGGVAPVDAHARAEHDVSSINHYAETTIAEIFGEGVDSSAIGGPMVRYSASADTAYCWQAVLGPTAGTYELRRWLNGVESAILASFSQVPAAADRVRVEVRTIDINTVRVLGYVNGALRVTFNDTSPDRITSGTRGGVRSAITGTGILWQDSFEVGDLVPPVVVAADGISVGAADPQAVGAALALGVAESDGSAAVVGRGADANAPPGGGGSEFGGYIPTYRPRRR